MEKKARLEHHHHNKNPEELPIVLQLLILTFLSVSDHLGTVSRLSKHWQRLTLLPSSWGPNIDLFTKRLTDVHFGKHFAKTRAQHFHLYCESRSTLTTLPSTLTSLTLKVDSLEPSCTGHLSSIPTASLRRLDYWGPWDGESSKWLLSAAPTLEHLTMRFNFQPNIGFDFLPALVNLKTLKCSVQNRCQLQDATACPALTNLDLCQAAYNLNDSDLIQAFDRHAPSLQRLETISMDSTEVTGQCFKSFAHLGGLRQLTCDAPDADIDGPLVYSENLSHLAHLPLTCLHLGPYIDHMAFKHLRHMPLVELGLYLTRRRQAAPILKALLDCPFRTGLQVLTIIDDDDYLDDPHLNDLLAQLPALREVSTSCRRLMEDDKGIKDVELLYPHIVFFF